MLTLTNFTGHPITHAARRIRSGLRGTQRLGPRSGAPAAEVFSTASRTTAHGVTLIGRLFDEGTLATAGLALEKSFAVTGERPPGFLTVPHFLPGRRSRRVLCDGTGPDSVIDVR